jgi:hypothetical protein
VIAVSRWTQLLAVLFAAITAGACAHHANNIPRAPWELRGAIVEATTDRIRVRHKSGDVVDIRLDDETAVLRDDKPVGRDGLRQGVRVRVAVEPMPDGTRRAQAVRLFGGHD